jgi:predicted transcriptional regulator
MAKQNVKDQDSRLTIRVDPEYQTHVQRAAMEMGLNQSILVRNAIQEYMERREKELSHELAAFFRRFRHDRNRPNML